MSGLKTMENQIQETDMGCSKPIGRVLFFSSVKDVNLLRVTGFYSTDIRILNDLGYNVKLSCSFWDFLKFWQYDIAFIYFWSKGLIPAVIGKLFFKKVMFTGGIDRLDRIYNRSFLDYTIRKLVFKLCSVFSDANIIVSKSDLKNIYATGFDVDRISYVPHVIDFEKYSYNANSKDDIITTVVWMEDKENVIRKGVDKLLYVFGEYAKINNKFIVKIIGSIGEGTSYLIGIAKELGIEDRVIFTGRICEAEKIKILKESKFYFQLSLYEGFGIAAIEALAAGNIVIHSGRGGLGEAIGSRGVLIEDIDAYRDIALMVNKINDNYGAHSVFIEDGVKHVGDQFSYRVRRDGIEEILKKLAGPMAKML